jgi:serine/threonine protein kinase
VERLSARLEAGEEINWEEVERDFPEHAAQARVLLPTLQRLAELSRASISSAPTGEPLPLGELGDYRIVREIGRGGMGVVYEAEQISLPRRVALKVLPFAAVMDPRHLQRFKNEARAAASLDHPNVVKVYGVGCERGVHFIALQFVDGRSMADLIRERRYGPTTDPPPIGDPDPTRTFAADMTDHTPKVTRPTATSPKTPLDAAFVRRVTEWGIEAAEALEHAHGLGIVHRDIKPGNLLIDGRGEIFVADFGLAKIATDPGVTATGDMLGTLRYMSPEQAGAQHDLVDHRADIYSLGVTLYELLTLTPAFEGADRQSILTRISNTDPVAPRKLDRRIPHDLETVILKAMEKDPSRRYQSAREFSDDLRRVACGEPVWARRARYLERSARWARRHSAAMWAGVVFLAMIAGVSATAAFVVWQQKREKDQALEEKSNALTEKEQAFFEGQKQRNRAASNLNQLLNSMGELLQHLHRKELADIPRIDEIRRSLAEKIQSSYERYVNIDSNDRIFRYETARAYISLSSIHELQGNAEKAWELVVNAAALAEALTVDYPEDPSYWKLLGHNRHYLALGLEDRNLIEPSLVERRKALLAFEKVMWLDPEGWSAFNNAACVLLSSKSAEHRDPVRAIDLAERAIELAPRRESCWNTLGTAHYRAGNLEDAVKALNESLHCSKGGVGSAYTLFYLAMSHSCLGRNHEGRMKYEQACDWMDQNGYGSHGELRSLRAEAGGVLMINDARKQRSK